MPEAVAAPLIFTGQEWLSNHVVLLEGEIIHAVLNRSELPQQQQVTELEHGMLVPGFIDIQVNGGGGALLNNAPTPATLDTISAAHLTRGTTSLLPTLLSDTQAITRAAIEAVAAADYPGILGIHLEGPHFATNRRGAHAAAHIRPLQEADLELLCALPQRLRTVVTLAPDTVTPQQINRLSKAGVIVCAGHSEATLQQAQAAVDAGLTGFTHLFNAMSPLTAREPGMVGAALNADTAWASIIADGQHVHPATIRAAWRAKAPGKLMLVSDAMATAASGSQSFKLYDENICLQDGRLENPDGVLAGSNITLLDAVVYCHSSVGLELDECLRMASLYPAQFLGCDDQLGRLAAGYRADMAHMTDDLQVLDTWVAGGQSV